MWAKSSKQSSWTLLLTNLPRIASLCFKQESLLPVHTKSAVKNLACLKLLWHGPGQSWPDLCLEDSWCTTKASPNLTGTDGLHTSFAASARKSEAHHRLLPKDGWAETVGRSGCTLEPNPTRYLDERWHLMTLFFSGESMKESANPSSVPTNITFITMSLCCSFTLTRGFAPFSRTCHIGWPTRREMEGTSLADLRSTPTEVGMR